MQAIINQKAIDVLIERKQNKNVYIRAVDDHTIKVTCNRLILERDIKRLIENNEKAILKMLTLKAREEEKKAYFWYLGKPYIPVLDGTSKTPYFDGTHIYAKDEKTLQKFYQKECFRIFQNELERILPSFTNIPFFTLKIRTMKTRWGVNNRGNNTITLNSELLKKDLDLLDYVIIHELCHFYEANHSDRFWRHVSEFYPHYKEARRRLRQ